MFFLLYFIEELVGILCPPGSTIFNVPFRCLHEHKCAHIIALDDGNFAAQPNNRCIWDIPSFTVKDNIPDWKVQTNAWNVEDSSQWRTEDTDKFFYEIEEKKK